jgi:PAS domain S-box-containing protein
VLHVAVILLVAPLGSRTLVAGGIGTATLAAIAFIAGHLSYPSEGALSRFAVSLIAIAITTILSLRDRSTRTTLGEQARLLELSHDTVIIRDSRDVIVYWNDGAEQLYGWTRQEALGRTCASLLKCSYPHTEVRTSLEADGHWSGEVVRTRRDGARLLLASRWLLRRDLVERAIGVIESSADLTDLHRADAVRKASEERYRWIFESAGFAAWEADWSETLRIVTQAAPVDDLETWLLAHPEVLCNAAGGSIMRHVNQAAADLLHAGSREQLIGSSFCTHYLQEAAAPFAHILAKLANGASTAESEVRIRTFDGHTADVVLRVTPLSGGEPWSYVLITAFDVTERNQARARIEETSAELAHAARVSLLGQMAASIAHEVNQPLSAIINYAKSADRWLSRPDPNIAESKGCLERIITNGTRAAEIITRVRALARKSACQTEQLELSELISDAVEFVRREARMSGVELRRFDRADLPLIVGDRVQIQQVLVNLIMNSIQAMREVQDRKKEIYIFTETPSHSAIQIAIQDCGTGFSAGEEAKIFEPFFTTRNDGMGMGLSICRSIIEGHGGQISVRNNEGPGATVAFTLPIGDGWSHHTNSGLIRNVLGYSAQSI